MLMGLVGVDKSTPAGPTYDTSPVTKYGSIGSQTAYPPNPGTYPGWDNPALAQHTGTFASCTADKNGPGQQELILTGFGFNLRPTATIDGFIVTWFKGGTYSDATKNCVDQNAQLVKAGTIQLTDKADTSTPWPHDGSGNAQLATVAYGTSTDLWNANGETWAAADVNNSSFGAAIACTNSNNNNPTGEVGYCAITVYFH